MHCLELEPEKNMGNEQSDNTDNRNSSLETAQKNDSLPQEKATVNTESESKVNNSNDFNASTDTISKLEVKLNKDASKLTENEWKQLLNENEYQILRERQTEPAFSGTYNKHFKKNGYYACRACKNPLYSWKSKFDSGCGWPAFENCFENSVGLRFDKQNGRSIYQIEIVCKVCNSHLGHALIKNTLNIGNDINDNHYQCVNSLSICYIDKNINDNQSNIEKLDLSAYASVFR